MNKDNAKPIVAVFGGSQACCDRALYDTSVEVGRVLAELGYTVANGGYGGTMEAVARGARAGGGRTIGVTCSIWKGQANEFIDEVAATASLPERLQTLIDISQAGCVILKGATGTLLELAMAWELAAKGIMPPRPIVCVGTFWNPLITMMSSMGEKFARHIRQVETPAELQQHFPRTAAGDTTQR